MGDHPQEYLAKSGYRSCLKVKTIKILFMVWLPAGTYCRNYGNLVTKKKAT
jgi:hypothetical protein